MSGSFTIMQFLNLWTKSDGVKIKTRSNAGPREARRRVTR